jgi:predicted amidohydrolase YtcJ
MSSILFCDGVFHSCKSEDDVFSYMTVENGVISGTFDQRPRGSFDREVSLQGQHVYPCLIDSHVHLLFTIVQMAMGMQICEITGSGVQPHDLAGVEQKIRSYARAQKKDAVITASNYVLSAIDERRLPTKDELDLWAEGRPIVVYNIDGHASSMSTAMLRRVGIDPAGHDGVLFGEAHERIQGRLTDVVSDSVKLADIARGVASLHNTCAEYGITIIGALEGNGDSPDDKGTALLVKLARHFDIGVRVYFQYIDIARARRYARYQKHLRLGGCGDWEMDGSTGAHSAAFHKPYIDSGRTSPCYYSQEKVDSLVAEADRLGYQISSHAIGEAAIERLISALNKTSSGRLHRIEHCEFHSDDSFAELKKGRYAVVMQPGYAWIDKRYLHTYTQFLPPEIIGRMKFRSLYRSGICLCGSSDSPVQSLDPYLQMLGMVDFYHPDESITPYEAFRTYTVNPARAILEEDEYGTLEPGKQADFFTAYQDFFRLDPAGVRDFRPTATYYGGIPYKQKKGTIPELIRMMLSKSHQI